MAMPKDRLATLGGPFIQSLWWHDPMSVDISPSALPQVIQVLRAVHDALGN
jgi:hypothetical protein